MSNEIGTSLTQFVSNSITQITAGLPKGFRLKEDIEFELSVIITGEIGGVLDLKVIKAGGKTNKEETQKIKFSVTDKEQDIDPIKEAQKKLLKQRGLI